MAVVLVLNTGSSSHKCTLFEGEKVLWQAHLEWKENYRDAQLAVNGEKAAISISSGKDGLEQVLKTLPQARIEMIGHRVVHGGETFQQTTLITQKVKEEIHKLAYLAPLHNPANLEGIETAEALFPDLPQFAIFDTAFHATLGETAYTYPIPYEWREKAVRRYGFHGISHAYCTALASAFLNNDSTDLKMINCHLGAGCSLCATKGGKSVNTTMGMTPLEGLMMASRSGTIDPGILLHLLKFMDVYKLDHLLNNQSGLLGISGISEDMRDIIEAMHQGNQRAKLAFDLFIHRLSGTISELIPSLGGLDVLIFTAGIGEHAQLVREKTCEKLEFLGVKIDRKRNESPSSEEREISADHSTIKVLVIPTDEEWEIAQECLRKSRQLKSAKS